jgi:hypothetical protein
VSLLLALLTLTWAQPEPPDQTLIYYNARMALREGEPLEAVKLWLLRGALEDRTGEPSPHEADFRSVTWAALGELGVCQDGYGDDEAGAGLWPLALHNWAVRNMGRPAPPKPARPFDAFLVGRQQRFVSINDVVSAGELGALKLFRGRCRGPMVAMLNAGEPPTPTLRDRLAVARLLRYLLQRGRETLDPALVRGAAAVEARLFDLHLQVTALTAREARQELREKTLKAMTIGLNEVQLQAMRDAADPYNFPPDSEPARILVACAGWSIDEWLSLTADRRLFLFDHARLYGVNGAALDAAALGLLDAAIARGDGGDAEAWIARYGEAEVAAEVLWGGDRGRGLLALDAASGFRERAVIALHRGVGHLERGDLQESLRSFAYALRYSQESRAGEQVEELGRRWLAFVGARFEITDELLVTLEALVPRRELSLLFEDLMWRAALRADRASFAIGEARVEERGALQRRLALLRPLAAGDVGGFGRGVQGALRDSPSEGLRFVGQLLDELEQEDGALRAAHLPTLEALRVLLQGAEREAGSGRQARQAGELLGRIQAMVEGLGALEGDARERARSLSGGEVFAGHVRLAPADPLPWPFRVTPTAPPSAFTAIELTPVEWRDEEGELVFGWRVEG